MRILSGIQPSGRLHIGNYFGMMEPSIQLQNEGEAYYFIANYHSLTTVHSAAELRDLSHELAVDFLACGLDPDKATFFRQSDVPEVTELTWILSTATPMGLLERCVSYKDKEAKGIETSHALFAYPVLMAADILLYDSDIVPVGKDQKQHLEVTRNIAQKINHRYGDGVLKIPAARIREATAAVPGLDGEKMSKSYGNTIAIFEEEKALKKKVMGIKTDSTPVEAPKDPDHSIILELYKLVADEADMAQMEAEFRSGGVGYGDFKKRLFGSLWEHFAPMRERRKQLLTEPDSVEKVLTEGAEKAGAVARATMKRVRDAVGL
jgi:tryptophanyl-tRNA synthetase